MNKTIHDQDFSTPLLLLYLCYVYIFIILYTIWKIDRTPG